MIRLLIALSVLALAPTVALADLASAQRLYEEGRADEALAEVNSLLASNAADPELRFLKGIIYAEQGRNDDAIEIFAALTQDYPELPEPYNNLAVLFAEKGEFEKAREALLAAIQTHPSYSTAHENLGDLYAKMASLAYDRALEEDKANESARIKLSAVNGLFSIPQSQAIANATAGTSANPGPASASTAAPAASSSPPAAAAPSEPAMPTPSTTVAAANPVAATPPPAPEPAPAETTPTPAPNSTADVTATIEQWRTAWSARDVQGYTGAYASDYAPSGMSHTAWLAQRRERLGATSFVKVSIDDLHVAFPSADKAKAEFTQEYQADNYDDRVHKTLTLSRTESGWRIVGEDSRPL
jgi:tetratricopeptide (TPR) repeat protein